MLNNERTRKESAYYWRIRDLKTTNFLSFWQGKQFNVDYCMINYEMKTRSKYTYYALCGILVIISTIIVNWRDIEVSSINIFDNFNLMKLLWAIYKWFNYINYLCNSWRWQNYIMCVPVEYDVYNGWRCKNSLAELVT